MIAALVLAAGSSSRMGRPKLTLDLGGVPLLEKVLDTLHRTETDEIVVVLGSKSSEVKRKVSFSDETIVVNKESSKGMSSSIRAGLAAVEDRADAVLIVLGDQPFVTAATINKMIEAYRSSKPLIVIPVNRGQRGNPVLFDKELFLEIGEISGDVGAKSVVGLHRSRVAEVPVDDPGILVDVDTPEDYSRITRPR